MDAIECLEARLFMGEQPTLDHDVWIDSYPDKPAAEAMRRAYVNLLSSRGLGERFGVYVRKLHNWAGWDIYIGPQDGRMQVKPQPSAAPHATRRAHKVA